MTATAAGTLAVRVAVADTWETFSFEVSAGESIGALKRRALEAARMDPGRGGAYEVKFGGALVTDETQALAQLGVPDGAQLVVVSRHRRPVR